MDRIIYTSMTGASAAAHRQAVLSNNLANVSTNGFRAEMSTFRSVPLQGDGSKTRVFALEATSGHVETPGPVQRTGRNLDAMAVGNAWFAVQGLDGTEAYTRAGSFQVTQAGQIVTGTGLPVLSDGGGPIDVPQGAEVSLGSDGTISARVPGQQPQNIGRLKLATPTPDDPLRRGDDTLFRPRSGDPMPNDPNARLLSGATEGSNVNAV
ncbi:MAG: flagellar hook-basal body complex protein, partial [Comamonadaceae bacterium]